MPSIDLINEARALRRGMTEAERVLWSRIRRRQLDNHRFLRQHPIGPYIPDFCCSALRLVFEVDGSVHLDGEVARRDRDRESSLVGLGYLIVRVSNRMVLKDIDRVVHILAKICSRRAQQLRDSPR